MSMNSEFGKGWNAKKSMTRALPESGVMLRNEVTEELLRSKAEKPSILIMILGVRDGQECKVVMARDNDKRTMENGKKRPTSGAYKTTFGSGYKRLDYDDVFAEGGGVDHMLYGSGSFIKDRIVFGTHAHVMSGDDWATCVWVATCPMNQMNEIVDHLNERVSELQKEGEDPRFTDFVAAPYDLLFDEDWRSAGGATRYSVVSARVIKLPTGEKYRIWDQEKLDRELGPVLLDDYFIRKSYTRVVTSMMDTSPAPVV